MRDFTQLVGSELGIGDWITIAQDRVDAFADATDDHQWIHEAGEAADSGPFGGPIAHGFLTLSLLGAMTRPVMAALQEGVAMIVNYGVDRVRFISPVPVGSRIRGRVSLAEARPTDGGVQLKLETMVELEGSDRPAAAIESLLRLYD